MRYLSLPEVLELHRRLIDVTGGSRGLRDLGALESAISQPHATFGGSELYPDILTKATALGFSLVMNHPFIDGNKRVGHASMETMLLLNGYEIDAAVDEQEQVILTLAAGELERQAFVDWLEIHAKK